MTETTDQIRATLVAAHAAGHEVAVVLRDGSQLRGVVARLDATHVFVGGYGALDKVALADVERVRVLGRASIETRRHAARALAPRRSA